MLVNHDTIIQNSNNNLIRTIPNETRYFLLISMLYASIIVTELKSFTFVTKTFTYVTWLV